MVHFEQASGPKMGHKNFGQDKLKMSRQKLNIYEGGDIITNNKKDIKLSIRVSAEEKSLIDAYCKENNISISQFVRKNALNKIIGGDQDENS